jgi:hypothetical protein
MATSITPATLTVTINESVILNGYERSGTNTLTIASVTEVDNRIVNVGTSEVHIIGFGSANGQGSFVRTDVKYIRITNKDDTNYVTLGVSKTGADTFFVKLEAGKSFMLGNDDLEVDASGGASSAFVEANNISAKANGAACDVEYFVALT